MCYVLTKQSLMLVFPITNSKFPPLRRDQNSKVGGKMVFIREGFIVKQMKKFEITNAETICLELIIAKKEVVHSFAYRPPIINKDKMLCNYDNIVLAGDLNINELNSCSDSSNHLSDMKDVFNLSNLIKEPTCFKSQNGTLLDLVLTNKPRSFMKSQAFELGFSNCHKLVCSILRARSLL